MNFNYILHTCILICFKKCMYYLIFGTSKCLFKHQAVLKKCLIFLLNFPLGWIRVKSTFTIYSTVTGRCLLAWTSSFSRLVNFSGFFVFELYKVYCSTCTILIVWLVYPSLLYLFVSVCYVYMFCKIKKFKQNFRVKDISLIKGRQSICKALYLPRYPHFHPVLFPAQCWKVLALCMA